MAGRAKKDDYLGKGDMQRSQVSRRPHHSKCASPVCVYTDTACMQVQEWLLWANTQFSPLRDDKLMLVGERCS